MVSALGELSCVDLPCVLHTFVLHIADGELGHGVHQLVARSRLLQRVLAAGSELGVVHPVSRADGGRSA